ncbi:MAG: hypothetical protein AVDCRST_MAG58-3647, partial [uncultured Rubrobacteraceae bacterium]
GPTQHHQVDSHRLAWAAPLWGADLLLKPRRPARPRHPTQGLVSLRHYQLLRHRPPVRQHPRLGLPDLRRICPGRLPRDEPSRTPGAVGYVPHGVGQRPVPATAGGHHLLRARGGAGGASGPRGVRGAALHLCQYRVRANRPGGHLARVRGPHPRGCSGVALGDAAQVGGSALGRRERADVLESDVRSDDRPREHPVYGAVGGRGAGDKRDVDSLNRLEPPLWCPCGGSRGGPAEGAL